MALHRHNRVATARRITRSALMVALVATLTTASAVAVGIALRSPPDPSASATARPAAFASNSDPGATVPEVTEPEVTEPGVTEPGATKPDEPFDVVSRSTARDRVPVVIPAKEPNITSQVATRRAIRQADTRLWTTTELNLWSRPGENAGQDGQLEASERILVTGRELWGRSEVVVGGKPRWITTGYLAAEQPVDVGPAAGLSMASCSDDSVESGLTDSAIYVFRSVCNAFPQIYDVIGYANRGEHSTGKALDLMISDVPAGLMLADFLRANAAELDLYNVIYRQRIFTPERGAEGWRSMENRGSATGNHMDHVHVSTY